MYRVVGEPDLRRDDAGILHNINSVDYRSFVAKRNASLENKQRIEKLEQDNAEIKQTLNLILQLLRDDNK